MSKTVYIVIASTSPRHNGDERYIIDGVYTSFRKAKKRANLLNAQGIDWLLDQYGCGLFNIEYGNIRTWDKTDL